MTKARYGSDAYFEQGDYERGRRQEDKLKIRTLYEEASFVGTGINAYGGGFMKALLGAIQRADIDNLLKIKQTWGKEWDQYLEMGQALTDNKEDHRGGRYPPEKMLD